MWMQLIKFGIDEDKTKIEMKEVSYYFRFLAEQKKKSNEQCIYIQPKTQKKEEEKKPQTQTKQTKAKSELLKSKGFQKKLHDLETLSK